ncbi:hypothetical protein RND71_035564 [Anisodus tanguticus]|uniref:RING-type E3 ubiquitin transferase n=1 Tax=Anisodus tanguticus TaxID=243964 RepID=A0AAE1R5G9_9SOLA|nr:hypothetical protein RND71_035564 [Anisodus tanguticus]
MREHREIGYMNFKSNTNKLSLCTATNNVNGYYYGENIDGVFVTDAAALFPTNMQSSQARNHRQTPPNHYRNSRNSTGNHLGPHNNSDFPNTGHPYSYLWDPYYYQPTLTDQFIDEAYVTTDDVNQYPFGYTALLGLGDDDTQVGDQEEIIIMLKTRNHCAKVKVNSEETVIGVDDSREEICTICLCEYVNDETIGTLECGHEYHASCIEQWLLRGKQNCPICRSSVLPSVEEHAES